MNFSNYLDRYLIDKTYTITIKNKTIHIINYQELEDFSNTKITVKHEKGKTIITGENLVVSKMTTDELLIIGKIKTVEV